MLIAKIEGLKNWANTEPQQTMGATINNESNNKQGINNNRTTALDPFDPKSSAPPTGPLCFADLEKSQALISASYIYFHQIRHPV